MTRTVAIVGFNQEQVNVYREQMHTLYTDSIEIKSYHIGEGFQEEINEEIVLITSFVEFRKIREYISSHSQVLFIRRTVSKKGMQKINMIPKGSKILLFDESIELAEQMIMTLHQIGIKHIDLIPATYCSYSGLARDYYITMGEADKLKNLENVIDIGVNILDISTIMDVAITLDLEEVLTRQNIKKGQREIITADFGLSGILGKTNKFESQVDIMLQVIDDGVLAINSDGIIFSYNDAAKRILGISDDGNKIDGISSFSQIPFEYVLNKCKSIKERLVKIREYDVVISVDPIIHSGKLYGAVAIIRRFSDAERKQHKLRAQLIGKGHKAKYTFEDIMGSSDAINRCKKIAKRMSNSDSSILISGESGTGKELFAQAIHNNSKRKRYQFVAVNCGALPESLLESELFGYEEGAFTGARKGGKPGLFELAHNGTLFLDEIGEMPIKLQMRLLRVLQEREVMRIGGDSLINVDLRIIAATNRDLKQMVNKGQFREDLYYRLNVLPLKTPPLRSRVDDILPLIDQMRKNFNSNFELSEDATRILLEHSWRGNVRELRNYIEYFVNIGNRVIDIEDLPMELGEDSSKIILDREEKDLVDRFFNTLGKNEHKYLFILEELEKAFSINKRIGRRSLYQRAKEKGIFIGEQEARTILLNLEKHLLVDIYKGRSGTVITDFGRKVLSYAKEG